MLLIDLSTFCQELIKRDAFVFEENNEKNIHICPNLVIFLVLVLLAIKMDGL